MSGTSGDTGRHTDRAQRPAVPRRTSYPFNYHEPKFLHRLDPDQSKKKRSPKQKLLRLFVIRAIPHSSCPFPRAENLP